MMRLLAASLLDASLPANDSILPAARDDVAPFQWGSALRQSGLFLGVKHGLRIATESKTRAELGGPFFRDWGRSLRGIRGWRDGDNTFTNYVAHPIMGATTGWIYVHNDPRSIVRPFSADPAYWSSRMRAMGWSAAYSTLFEIGPVSEANIGNVGLRPNTNGAVDLVVTPTLGTGLLVMEDAVDRFVISTIERRISNRVVVAASRGLLNPNRSLANIFRLKWPWHRDARPALRNR